MAVVIGASSKWQSNGRHSVLVHGGAVDDGDLRVGVCWGIGGAIAQRFAEAESMHYRPLPTYAGVVHG